MKVFKISEQELIELCTKSKIEIEIWNLFTKKKEVNNKIKEIINSKLSIDCIKRNLVNPNKIGIGGDDNITSNLGDITGCMKILYCSEEEAINEIKTMLVRTILDKSYFEQLDNIIGSENLPKKLFLNFKSIDLYFKN